MRLLGRYNGFGRTDHWARGLEGQPGKPLLHAIGSKEERLKWMLSRASELFSLVIEYVQRFADVAWLFAKQSLGYLTQAIGGEGLLEMQVHVR